MSGGQLVIGASYGPAGASTRVRVLDWLRFLDLRADVLDYLGTANVRPATLLRRPLRVLAAERRLRALRRGPAWQRLLISRSMGPFTGGRLEADLLQRAGWGVYDFDDALYADARGGVHRFFGEAAGWSTAVRGADLVIAGNATLAEAAARLNPEVRVIPSCVEPRDYPRKTSYEVGPVPRLIWIGSPSTEPFLQPVTPALLRVHRLTGARLTVVSTGRRPLGELDLMTDRVEWDGARTDALLADADCGIMPIPDTPFTRGKCAYKLLQYGAAGLPAVGSPVGVNAGVIDQLDGEQPGDADQWADALRGVLQEPVSRRRARGEAARTAVEDHYSFDAWRPEFLRALRLPDPTRRGPAPDTDEPARDERTESPLDRAR
jgi:glycosyltransferase involved in cell wall biosynthesis